MMFQSKSIKVKLKGLSAFALLNSYTQKDTQKDTYMHTNKLTHTHIKTKRQTCMKCKEERRWYEILICQSQSMNKITQKRITEL